MDEEKINLIKRIYRKEDISKIDEKIKLFGINQKFTTEYFLNMRFFTTIVIFLFVFLFIDYGFVYAPIVSAIYYYAIYYLMIDLPLRERTRKLEHEAFYYFEVLTLTIESGRNLETSIEIACTYINSDISNEFKETLHQIKFGKSLSEALSDMRLRIPSEVINNIILNITQSNIFGSGILETMYNQLDFLRDKQILDIKAEIGKIPTKISIFSVLFFIPLMMMLIVAPLIIDYIMNS
jgi:pilus assembly protein TadC